MTQVSPEKVDYLYNMPSSVTTPQPWPPCVAVTVAEVDLAASPLYHNHHHPGFRSQQPWAKVNFLLCVIFKSRFYNTATGQKANDEIQIKHTHTLTIRNIIVYVYTAPLDEQETAQIQRTITQLLYCLVMTTLETGAQVDAIYQDFSKVLI